MPSASGRVIDGIVRGGISDWFRLHGFAQKGRSFVRAKEGILHTAYLQASKSNMPASAVFALNIGVEWVHWHDVWTDGRRTVNPALAPTFIQARVHPEVGPGRDYWWAATEQQSLEIASEVVAALGKYAETFWTHNGDFDSVLSDMDAGVRVPTGTPRRLVHAALLVRANRVDDARRVLREARRRAPINGANLVDGIETRLGLADMLPNKSLERTR
jgi:hypothetical protein